MTEQNQNKTEKPIENPFETCGFLELAPSGKSIRIIVTPQGSVFEETYYVGREANTAVLHGHKKTATVYRLKDR